MVKAGPGFSISSEIVSQRRGCHVEVLERNALQLDIGFFVFRSRCANQGDEHQQATRNLSFNCNISFQLLVSGSFAEVLYHGFKRGLLDLTPQMHQQKAFSATCGECEHLSASAPGGDEKTKEPRTNCHRAPARCALTINALFVFKAVFGSTFICAAGPEHSWPAWPRRQE